jgi:hypothetical protein
MGTCGSGPLGQQPVAVTDECAAVPCSAWQETNPARARLLGHTAWAEYLASPLVRSTPVMLWLSTATQQALTKCAHSLACGLKQSLETKPARSSTLMSPALTTTFQESEGEAKEMPCS